MPVIVRCLGCGKLVSEEKTTKVVDQAGKEIGLVHIQPNPSNSSNEFPCHHLVRRKNPGAVIFKSTNPIIQPPIVNGQLAKRPFRPPFRSVTGIGL